MGVIPPERGERRRLRLPGSLRIRRGSQIRAILANGRRDRSPHLDVYSTPAAEGTPRFGTVVPRYGRTAVARNKLRRRLKEIGRTELMPGLARMVRGVDVLVRSRPSAYDASFAQLKLELVQITERLCSDASS